MDSNGINQSNGLINSDDDGVIPHADVDYYRVVHAITVPGNNVEDETEGKLETTLARNEYPDLSNAKSLMARYLTRDVFMNLRDKRTNTGFTIAKAVNSGVLNKEKSEIGCHAGDAESYSLFADFYNPLIEHYHGGFKPTDRHFTDMEPSHITEDIADKLAIASTRIRIARNITGFNLAPGQQSRNEKLEIESLLKQIFRRFKGELSGKYYSLVDMTKEGREQLISDHILFKENDPMQSASGYHKWWPYGRGVYLNSNRTFIVWVNEGDHLRIISLQQGGDVKSVFNNLVTGAKIIEDGIKEIADRTFQQTGHLGMISCCPTNLGTGLRGSVLVKLKGVALTLGKKELCQWCSDRNLQVRGLYGEHTEGVDDTYDISNKYRLGYSETELVQNMIVGVNELLALEREYST